MKTWFFKQVESNMKSRPLQEISLESISQCSFPMMNIFTFGYPHADNVDRYCMCEENGDFSKIDEAILNGENVSDLTSNLTCKCYDYFALI